MLVVPHDLTTLIRERVASLNGCLFCMDVNRAATMRKSMKNKDKFDAIAQYRTSNLFTDKERAALDYATELTENKHVNVETFKQLARYYSEREICDIVWLVTSEHLWNINNIGLNIGSDGFCDIIAKKK
jgi:alkylhydroperoxidase family enzyme